MAEFLTKLTATQIAEDTQGRAIWKLHEPLNYQSDILGNVIVPEGFETDFASVPKFFVTWGLFGGTGNRAAVVHDYLIRESICIRSTADEVFKEALSVSGVPGWKRWFMYLGVRIGTAWSKGKELIGAHSL